MGNITDFGDFGRTSTINYAYNRGKQIQGTQSPSLHFAALLENVPHATREQMWV